MKFCKDCRYVRPFVRKFLWFTVINDMDVARCLHPNANRTDAVTGESDPKFCSAVRIHGCGEEGHWFEPKEAA